MKTILLIILFLTSSNLLSQWEKITYEPIIPTKPYGVNGDSVYVFRDKVGWFKSYDSGDNWELDNNIFKSEEGNGMYPVHISPIFKDNMVYLNDGNSGKIQISSDYGKTFLSSLMKTHTKHENENDFSSSYIKSLIFDDNSNIIFATSMFGLFISYDKGYTWHHKLLPGVVEIFSLDDIIFPEDMGGVNPSKTLHTGLVILDTTLLISGFRTYGGIFKTIVHDKYDSLNTLYFPVSRLLFLKQRNETGNDSLLKYFHRSLRSFNLIKFKKKIYVIFTTSVIQQIRDPEYMKVWTSDDEGETWQEQDYSEFGLNSIFEIRSYGDILYMLDYQNGIFMSEDEGQTWQKINLMKSQDYLGEREITDCVNLQFSENYAFLQTNYGLCRAPLKDCKIVTEQSSVESSELTPLIYPNPASESITISGIGQGIVTIYNTLGQKLIEKEIFGTSTINTNDLQTGMYVIKLESGGEVVFEKVIVNR